MAEFLVAFGGTWLAILKVFVVVLAAGILVRRGVLTDTMVTSLSTVTVVLFLPCLIFSKVVANFEPRTIELWWALPIAGLLMPVLGLVPAAVAFARELPEKRSMLALASMQNAGYLVLPVGLALFPDEFDRFALYCFLFILGFNALLWSLGKVLVTNGQRNGGWKGLITPPLVANLAAVTLALTGFDRFIPAVFIDAVDLVGQAAVPVATVVLGAILGGVAFRLRPYLWDAVRVLTIKLGLLPAATIVLVHATGLGASDPLLAKFLILEAAAAPASGLILQVRTYGGDEQKVGSLMLLCYAACMVTMPLWLATWYIVTG